MAGSRNVRVVVLGGRILGGEHWQGGALGMVELGSGGTCQSGALEANLEH